MRILLLGSTGSIGRSTCNCVRRFPDRFQISGLAANRSVDALLAQVNEFTPAAVSAGTALAAQKLRETLGPALRVYEGEAGLEAIVNETDYDVLLNGLVGAVGLRPTVAALRRNKRVALANKESLVIGGELIVKLLDAGHGEILPVDSEHSAILQCLCGEEQAAIESLILTASGGPFRKLAAQDFKNITPEQALKHPTWSMGKKITIDAGTLINKGFEVIEAHYLFRVAYDRIRVVIHPQSIIHSMLVFHDGAVMAQCGLPDMELPIQFALSYPHRLPMPGKRLNLPAIGSLEFFEPDIERFPCLNLCIQAGLQGGTLPAVLNAANEIAVHQFLDGKIGFHQIQRVVEDACAAHSNQKADSVEIIEQTDRRTRETVLRSIKNSS